MAINCLRAVPKIPFPSKPKSANTHSALLPQPLFFFSRRASLLVTAATAFSPMSYDKELAAAKKAASLAATLCQASLSLSLYIYIYTYTYI